MGIFKEGDVVELKSHGPTMTISDITETMEGRKFYHCQWFTGSKLQDGYFLKEALVIPKKEKPKKMIK